MEDFDATRLNYTFTQLNDAPPERVFPLLCPVRETDWLPGWKYRLIYSRSGVAEDGCVFTTHTDKGTQRIWMTTHYDPASYTIAYAWVEPGMIATQLRIALSPAPGGKTSAHIRFMYTGLSPAGNGALAGYTREWFEANMKRWERAINHYLHTGTLFKEVA